MRSPWKKFYVDFIFKKLAIKPKIRLKDMDKKLTDIEKKALLGPIFIDNRATTILRSMVGRKAGIHNGKEYMGVTIKDYMIGHKFGEYVATRKVGKDMHFRKKGKKAMQQGMKKKK